MQRSKVALSLALTSKKSLQFDRGYWYLFLSMPMMYATSVGVLLFGIEKESRSLQWMRSLPTSSKQIAWNKLVVAIGTLALVWLIASAIALLAVAILVWQWIAWERTIAENEEQLRSASEAIFQTPAEPLAEITPKTQPTDPALKSQWEEILSQVQHPYFKNQIDLFFQEPEFSPDSQVVSPQDKHRVVWSMLPESLGKFVHANRTFLDSIHCVENSGTVPELVWETNAKHWAVGGGIEP
jgi:hypothetical protein